jgi:hypothetical protein
MLDPAQKGQTELDPEADGEGLLWVDLLSLPRTFSWSRYRIDLLGLLVAGLCVALLMSALVAISRIL